MLTHRPRPRPHQARRLLVTMCLCLLAMAAAATQTLAVKAHTHSSRPIASAARVIPRSLRVEATRSTKADRVLVADAKTLKRCLSRHPGASKKCNADRRAVQRAGSRLAIAESKLAKAARSTGKASGSGSTSGTPTLRTPRLNVSGQTLTWTRTARIKSYVLARKVPGQTVQYLVVNGTSVTPPPVPGATVGYSVRTAVNGSTWSAEASIAYPPAKVVGSPPPAERPSRPKRLRRPKRSTPSPPQPSRSPARL